MDIIRFIQSQVSDTFKEMIYMQIDNIGSLFVIQNSQWTILNALYAIFDSSRAQIDELLKERKYSDFFDFLNETSNQESALKIQKDSEEILNIICDSSDYQRSAYKMFKEIVGKILSNYQELTIGVELIYIDRIYRDTYYHFFSGLHAEYPRICKRLVFFSGNLNFDNYFNLSKKCEEQYNKILNEFQNAFLGSMVIRPLRTGAIGRTLLNPKAILGSSGEYCLRTSQWNVDFMGMELFVNAFPYMMQDGVVASCAETTILLLMDYYSRQYNDYKFALPSAISQISMREKGTRAIPTNGLSYEAMSKILCEFGFYTIFDCNFNLVGKLRSYLYYYIESGIPVIINMQKREEKTAWSNTGHAALCIGHGKKNTKSMLENIEYEKGLFYANTAMAFDGFYVMDDNLSPYSYYNYISKNPRESGFNSMKKGNGDEVTIDCYIVPLHKHMYMDASRAENIVMEILNTYDTKTKTMIYNPTTYFHTNEWGSFKNPIIYRLFLASSRHLKQHRLSHVEDENARKLYFETPFPQFVWVCELYDTNGYEKNLANGEIIIDATRCSRSSLSNSVLMINYSGSVHFGRNYNDSIIAITPRKNSGKTNGHIKLEQFTGNTFNIPSYNLNLHNAEFRHRQNAQ